MSVAALCLLVGVACSSPRSPLSDFAEGGYVTGRVLNNSTACEVDAVCFLRVAFADTTVTVIYGLGDVPASECKVPREASDAAFRVSAGAVVEVLVERCASEGLFLWGLVGVR